MHVKTHRGNIHKQWRVGYRYIKKHRLKASDLLGNLIRDMATNPDKYKKSKITFV